MIEDILNLVGKLTARRIGNILLTECSYWLSAIIKRPVVWGLPHSYSIEPTSSCNLRCPECPTGKGEILRNNRDIPYHLFESVVEQIAKTTTYVMLYLQGEPFMSKSIFKMIRLADQNNLYTCISTNGHYLNEENAINTVKSGLDRIIISLDGTTPDVYKKYRVRGNYHEVISGIKNLVAAKSGLKSKTPYIIIQFIVFKHNEHQVEEVKTLAKTLGANKVEIKSAQLYEYENGHPMLTDLTNYARYKKKDEHVVLKRKIHNRCKRIWTIGVITTDGSMTPCCYDKNAIYTVGNSSDEKLKNLWKSPAFMKHRKLVLHNRSSIEMCSNCTE